MVKYVQFTNEDQLRLQQISKHNDIKYVYFYYNQTSS